QTSPMPPAPIGERISYGPRRVPTERVIGATRDVVSLQSLDDVEVGGSLLVTVDVTPGVRRDEDRIDLFDSGGGGRNDLFPELALFRREVEAVDSGRRHAGTIDQERPSVS